MDRAVSPWLLMAEAGVWSQNSLSGIYGENSGTGTALGFYLVSIIISMPYSYISFIYRSHYVVVTVDSLVNRKDECVQNFGG
jgi:hypothetical protein